jgi:hypothetical protein
VKYLNGARLDERDVRIDFDWCVARRRRTHACDVTTRRAALRCLRDWRASGRFLRYQLSARRARVLRRRAHAGVVLRLLRAASS